MKAEPQSREQISRSAERVKVQRKEGDPGPSSFLNRTPAQRRTAEVAQMVQGSARVAQTQQLVEMARGAPRVKQLQAGQETVVQRAEKSLMPLDNVKGPQSHIAQLAALWYWVTNNNGMRYRAGRFKSHSAANKWWVKNMSRFQGCVFGAGGKNSP